MEKFTNKYYRSYLSSSNSLREYARSKLNLSPKVRDLFRCVQKLPQGARVLDVGCGIGGLLELIEKERGDVETIGTDIGLPPTFRQNGKFVRSSALQLPFESGTFDLVTCAHVIEHISEPYVVLAEMLRVCRPGGHVYIETPSQRAALMPIGFSFWDDPTHIRPYSAEALRKMLEEAGLESIRNGVKKSLAGVLLGLPYMLIGRLLGDEYASETFLIYGFGLTAYAIGVKSEIIPEAEV